MVRRAADAFAILFLNRHFASSLVLIVVGLILLHITSRSFCSSVGAFFFGFGLFIFLAGTVSMSVFITKNAPSGNSKNYIRNEVQNENSKTDLLLSRASLFLILAIGLAITLAGSALIGSTFLLFLGFIIIVIGLMITGFGIAFLFLRTWLMGLK